MKIRSLLFRERNVKKKKKINRKEDEEEEEKASIKTYEHSKQRKPHSR